MEDSGKSEVFARIDFEGILPEDRERSLDKIQAFVTRTWEHPLLDKKTREHRQKFIDTLNNTIVENGLSLDNYTMVPVGGDIWISDVNSDWEGCLIAKTQDDLDKLIKLKPKDFGFVSTITLDDFLSYELAKAKTIPFMFTPNEYVAGSIHFADEIRKQLSGYMLTTISENMRSPEGYGSKEDIAYSAAIWDGEVKDYFYTYYSGWLNPNHETRLSGGDKRNKRFLENIKLRALKTHMSEEKYKSNFLKSLRKHKVPDIRDFYLGFSVNGGSLNISPKYVSEGI